MNKTGLKITAGVLSGMLTVGTAGTAFPVMASTTNAGVSDYAASVLTEGINTTAGLSSIMADVIQKADSEAILASAQPEVKKNETPKVASPYADMAVAQVKDFVYIRKKADENSKYVGKLYTDCVGKVLEKKGNWYKIKSGSVTGYVSADYVKVGDEKLAKSVGTRLAKVKAETLRVREDTSKKSNVLGLVSGEDELIVIDESDKKWVGVSTEEGTGYVSSEFLSIKTEYKYAESKKEEKARLKKEKKERLEAEKVAAEAEQQEQEEAVEETPARTEERSNKPEKKETTKKTETRKAETKKTEKKKPVRRQSASEGDDEEEVESESSSGTGSKVADYACRFIGNPYKWGGSSLTHGTDCSGFVMSVYAHFGISLPHSSSAQRGVGRSVSKSNMKPGDIVCYSGHVGIYIGGNTIVHASNPSDGIKTTSPANYRRILSVRRIF